MPMPIQPGAKILANPAKRMQAAGRYFHTGSPAKRRTEIEMDQTERIIMLGFAPDASPDAIEAMAADLRLARILLRRGMVRQDGLEAAVKLRNTTGLLLEHCLVSLGQVEFDAMLEAMAERRSIDASGDARRRLPVTLGTAFPSPDVTF